MYDFRILKLPNKDPRRCYVSQAVLSIRPRFESRLLKYIFRQVRDQLTSIILRKRYLVTYKL